VYVNVRHNPKNQAAESIGDRALSFVEIKLLWNDTTLSPRFLIAVKLLLLYGGRSSEVIEATKEELDFNSMVWALPPVRTKNKKWLLLPITPMAKQLFDELWP
jgi:integrase